MLTHRNNFTSPLKLAMSTAMQYSAPTPSNFTSGQHFLETFTLLPETTRATNSRWLQCFSPQTANTTFATLWRTYLPHMSNDTRCFLHSLITSFHFLSSFFPTRLAAYQRKPLIPCCQKKLSWKLSDIWVLLFLYFSQPSEETCN